MTKNLILVEDETRLRHKLKHVVNSVEDTRIVGSANSLYRAYELIKENVIHMIVIDAHFVLEGDDQFVRKLLNLKPLLVMVLASEIEQKALVTIRNEVPIHHIIIKEGASGAYDQKHFLKALSSYSYVVDSLYKKHRERQAESIAKKGDTIIAIGASTGGVQAIELVLSKLTGDIPPILLVQHISKSFSGKMADRICKSSKITVKEAEQGEVIRKNMAYLAPGDQHMTMKLVGSHYEINLDEGPMVHFQRPAVENLFHSVAQVVGDQSIGVLLTGMGSDGAEGLLAMKQAGAYTLAQDAHSSIIFGMPKAAIEIGAACEVVHLDKVAGRLWELSQQHHYDRTYRMIV